MRTELIFLAVAGAGAIVTLGALVALLVSRRRRVAPPVALMVMPELTAPPHPPRRRLAKGSVAFATVDQVDDVYARRSLRPSHARRAVT